MRTGLNLVQTNILDADKKLEVFWALDVDLGNDGTVDYYWSTKQRTWDSNDYVFKIKDFTNISMSGGNEVFGLSAPANITIQVINKDNVYTPSDFVGASITIRLIMKADLTIDPSEVEWEGELEGEHICTSEILSWSFKVKVATSTYQILNLQCTDWLQEYLEGDYPNGGLANDIFPVAKMQNDNICIPKIWGEPFIPIRWTRDDTEGFYILGNGDHTVSEMRSPKEFGSRTDFLESDPDNTFTLKTKAGADGTTYDVVQFIVVDANADGTNDSNAMFGPTQGPYYDVPCRYSKSETIDTTNPIEIVKEIIEDYGVPSTLIDSTSYTEAYDIWDARGLKFDVGLFYKQPRKKLLAKLLTMCNSRLIVRDKLYFKVNSTASQHTINNSWVAKPRDVGEGYFRIRSTLTSIADGGYVTYAYKDGSDRDPIDQLIKTVVPTGTNSIAPADITIEAEYINDSTHAQKIGIMGVQKMMTKEHEITSKLKAKCLEVECGDIVTIEGGNYGAISGDYTVLITNMSINRSGQVDVVLAKFKDDLDDWGDLTLSGATIQTDDTEGIFSSVISGPATPGAANDKQMNIMYGIVRIGGDAGHILLNSDSSYISIGSPPPSSYGNNEGVWLGIDSANPKLSLYKDANNYMQYDPSASPALIIKSELWPTGNSDAYSITNDTLDDVVDGATYGRILGTDLTNGHVYLGSVSGTLADISGDLDDITDGGTYSRIKTASVQDGDILLATTIGDLDDVDDGGTYEKVLATSITAGKIIMAQIDGDLDDISNGGTYGKVNLTSISAGKIILAQCDGDLDDVDNGTYGKVLTADISAGHVVLSACSGDLDDIDDGGSYEKVLATDVSAGHIVLSTCSGDLDDIDNGTYGKVLTTHISSGVIKLSSQNSIAEGGLSGNSRVILSTSGISCYNSVGTKTVEIKTDGDITLGDYAGGNGLFYDNSATDFIYKTSKAGKFSVLGGGDIQLTGSDTDPGLIVWKSAAYNTEFGASSTGRNIVMRPVSNGLDDLSLGTSANYWQTGPGRFGDLSLYSSGLTACRSGTIDASHYYNAIYANGPSGYVTISLWDMTEFEYYYFKKAYFYFGTNKGTDLGRSNYAWEQAYANDWNNVADFFYMDDRKEADKVVEIDDVEVIKSIKSSDKFDEKTGLRLIDDDSLPEWILCKDKKTKEILYDHYDSTSIEYIEDMDIEQYEGNKRPKKKIVTINNEPKKPYLSLKTMISLLMGAVRQIDERLESLEEKIK